jgi:putative membrane protein
VEHLAFLITAMLFWWVLLRQTGPKYLHYATAIPYLFTTGVQSGILGALMTFTSRPWYSYYTVLGAPWGLTPLEDQQLAGLIMWLPGGAVFTLLTIVYFAAWLRALEERSVRLERPDYVRTRQ